VTATTSASIRVHGPWQIAATGLPVTDELLDEADRVLVDAQQVGVDGAAGSSSASYSGEAR